MDNYKHKIRKRGKDKAKEKFDRFGKNTPKGERIKATKASNSQKKK